MRDATEIDGTLTMDGSQRSELMEWVKYRLAKRPETPEDALAVVQAFWDVVEANGGDGFTFSVPKEKAEVMDANPMLERYRKRHDPEPVA